VHGGIDPTSALRHKNLPIIGSNRVSMGVADELGLEEGEMLKKKCREVSIFSEVE
jgi:hypothetical protein